MCMYACTWASRDTFRQGFRAGFQKVDLPDEVSPERLARASLGLKNNNATTFNHRPLATPTTPRPRPGEYIYIYIYFFFFIYIYAYLYISLLTSIEKFAWGVLGVSEAPAFFEGLNACMHKYILARVYIVSSFARQSTT